MSNKYISKILILIGLGFMVAALLTDTSVNHMHNLSKAADQQNLLLIGGFLFLAGIILTAVENSKGKQVQHSDSALNAGNQARSEMPTLNLREQLSWSEHTLLARVLIGTLTAAPISLFAALFVSPFLHNSSVIIGIAVFGGLIAYSIRGQRPAKTLLYTAAISMAILTTICFFIDVDTMPRIICLTITLLCTGLIYTQKPLQQNF